jgi:SAM-dependent methyltransferase
MNIHEKAKSQLKALINRESVLVDRYDSCYIDDFEDILRESHSIVNTEHPKIREIASSLQLTQQALESMTLKGLASIIKSFITSEDFQPYVTTEAAKRRHRYHLTKNWENNRNIKYDGKADSLERIIDVQVEYSHNQGAQDESWSQRGNIIWDRSLSEPGIAMPSGTFGEIKDKVIKKHIKNNKSSVGSDSEVNMLCIGPRWTTEIDFLRERFNIGVHGLDLFSADESKIFVGDMHNMPLEDNSYSILYQKNTYNKSYDIRRALDESVRVLRPGGILISDECLDYTIGVNEVARTNIKTNKWYTRYLQTKNNLERVVVDVEYDTKASWINKTGLYAAIIKK